MAENYDLIFGQGASSQYAWSDSDYQNGWKTVGSTPPTAEQFDALQRRSDTKAKDLNNRLSPLETTASKALARVTPAANRLPYFNSSNSATTTAISDFIKTLLDDKDAATARATLGAPSTTGGGASGTWGINISGNAASATKATSATTAAACSGNSATATKLATPRTISLTGNASGSANFDGSGDVSIKVTVDESKQAADVTNATVSPGASNNTNVSVPASGAINNLSEVTGSTDLTSTNKLRSYIGSIISNDDRYNVISIRHRNGATDGANYGMLIYSGLTDASSIRYRKQERSAQWTEERTLLDSSNYNSFAPTKTGGGASGTWGINISGNADSATDTDKVDGYHASDLLRTLGGNRTPVITDIFDRAGTIDMSTMSAADKATNKANINKASNMTQNLWNNSSGIRAYGGDTDMNGYSRGTLKLTQSYKNFDKILVVNSNDEADWIAYCIWDVWELAHAFANSYRFNLLGQGDIYWNLYGTAKHGTTTNYAVSTDTVWSCQKENSGIIAIYGIKF